MAKIQEEFNYLEQTLRDLARIIMASDIVFQIGANGAGFIPGGSDPKKKKEQIEALLNDEGNEGLERWVLENYCGRKQNPIKFEDISYTHWEVLLAKYYKKKVRLFLPKKGCVFAEGEPEGVSKFEADEDEKNRQLNHVKSLRQIGLYPCEERDRANLYARVMRELGSITSDPAFAAISESILKENRFGESALNKLKGIVARDAAFRRGHTIAQIYCQITGRLDLPKFPIKGNRDYDLIHELATHKDTSALILFAMLLREISSEVAKPESIQKIDAWIKSAMETANLDQDTVIGYRGVVGEYLSDGSLPEALLDVAPRRSGFASSSRLENLVTWGGCSGRLPVGGEHANPRKLLTDFAAHAKQEFSHIPFERMAVVVPESDLNTAWDICCFGEIATLNSVQQPFPTIVRLDYPIHRPNLPDSVAIDSLSCNFDGCVGLWQQIKEKEGFFAVVDTDQDFQELAAAVKFSSLGIWIRKKIDPDRAREMIGELEGVPVRNLPAKVHQLGGTPQGQDFLHLSVLLEIPQWPSIVTIIDDDETTTETLVRLNS